MTHTPAVIYLKDYQPANYRVDHYELSIKLFNTFAEVTAELDIIRSETCSPSTPLVLDGDQLSLQSVYIDGQLINEPQYRVGKESLTISGLPARCKVKTVVHIDPHHNTSLTGLYCSNNNYCTQCESHGFRRICYSIDRPDVLATFRTTIEADAVCFPQLLANGNPIAKQKITGDRHSVTWENPFRMPCYLFAMVAGDMAVHNDSYVTSSGRQIDLQLYLEKHNAGKGAFALDALKAAMRWDEEQYGLEYDLDIYMIVAVSDFNMGAMENKGLNIFNDKYILADSSIATDADYQNIFQVVGHEYFHNWSGNRVTLRDWFQLSLKEGFTVFREQCFAADHSSAAIRRIEDVRLLKNAQFSEDAGPMAHPVRPESYIEMNNFYTATVYEKGSEVIRMLHTLLGKEKYRQACDSYFKRFDGQAVTTDDFVEIMAQHYGEDLTQFKRWYSQSGTPHVAINWVYHDKEQRLELTFKQETPPTADQSTKAPLHIPIRMALLGETGARIPFTLPGQELATEAVYSLKEGTQTLVLSHINQRPVPSLFRGFSAPVKSAIHYTPDELVFLSIHDDDPCARYEAITQVLVHELFHRIDNNEKGELSERLKHLLGAILNDENTDMALIAHLLWVPSEHYFSQIRTPAPVDGIIEQRAHIIQLIGKTFYKQFENLYAALKQAEYHVDQHAIAKRSLSNVALFYLVASGESQAVDIAATHYFSAHNMTDSLGGLRALNDVDCIERAQCLQDFYDKWEDNALVLDKWLAMQANSRLAHTREHVRALSKHPAFSYTNPNKVYSLFAQFGSNNFAGFHEKSGEGYRLIEETVILLNKINPQVGARIIKPLISFAQYEPQHANQMKAALERIAAHPGLSKDIYEIVTKSLNQSSSTILTEASDGVL